MKQNPVVWFEIYVKDMARARAFYESLLAIRLERLSDPGPGVTEMWTFPSQKDGFGATGALVTMVNGPGGGNATLVYFGCEDCAVEARRALSSGGKVMKEKFSIGQYGHIAIVTDPDGNAVGLHSMK